MIFTFCLYEFFSIINITTNDIDAIIAIDIRTINEIKTIFVNVSLRIFIDELM